MNFTAFDIKDEVAKIGVKSCSVTFGVKISHKETNQVSIWESDWCTWREQVVPVGESIIGVYGYTNPKNNYIANFGFITVDYK